MELKIRDVLAAARAAYAAGQLQAQTGYSLHGGKLCLYDGPCAIGAAIPKDLRQGFDVRDGGTSIKTLIDCGLVTTDDRSALIRLQQAHDSWVDIASNKNGFEAILTELEARYLG